MKAKRGAANFNKVAYSPKRINEPLFCHYLEAFLSHRVRYNDFVSSNLTTVTRCMTEQSFESVGYGESELYWVL